MSVSFLSRTLGRSAEAVDLGEIPLFHALNSHDLQKLASEARVVNLGKDESVMKQGDPADALYVILSGSVKIFLKQDSGPEIVLARKGAKEYFGEMMLDHRPRSASVSTLEPSRLAVISHAHFKRFLRESPDAAEQVILNLIKIARSMNERARESMTIPERVRQYSDRLAGADAAEERGVKRWVAAKRWVLGALLLFALMQYYFLDVFLRMMENSGLLVFR
jgi:CRP/FNR family transcriptional regulator, cyclic AMP receptor protein